MDYSIRLVNSIMDNPFCCNGKIVSGKTIENEVLDLGKLIKNEKNGRQTLTYECVADNGIGDALRKSITISYNGE